MSEKDKTVIELHSISSDVMGVLLDFVYTETVNVNVENVQELLPAACLLQLTGQSQIQLLSEHQISIKYDYRLVVKNMYASQVIRT